jgi:hypothetical protein
MMSGPADFPTTRWSLAAGANDPDRPDCCLALESLCEAYRYPLYVCAPIRRITGTGPGPHARLLPVCWSTTISIRADAERGRFRSFPLSSFKYYRRDQADRVRASRPQSVTRVPQKRLDPIFTDCANVLKFAAGDRGRRSCPPPIPLPTRTRLAAPLACQTAASVHAAGPGGG